MNRFQRLAIGCVVVASCVLGAVAWGGERYLGTIYTADAGIRHNLSNCTECTTLYADGGSSTPQDGGCTLSDGGFQCLLSCPTTLGTCFAIPSRAKVTVQCNANSYVTVGATTYSTASTATSTRPVRIDANVAFPTSVTSGLNYGYIGYNDGGVANIQSGVISVGPVSGATTDCTVWERIGDEW